MNKYVSMKRIANKRTCKKNKNGFFPNVLSKKVDGVFLDEGCPVYPQNLLIDE